MFSPAVDIPSYLGVKSNPSATANYESRLTPPHGCTTIGVAVFSVSGEPLDTALLPTSTQAPAATTVLLSGETNPRLRIPPGMVVGAPVAWAAGMRPNG